MVLLSIFLIFLLDKFLGSKYISIRGQIVITITSVQNILRGGGSEVTKASLCFEKVEIDGPT